MARGRGKHFGKRFAAAIASSISAALSGRERAKRPPESEEPPPLAGVGAPLIPRTPLLSGGVEIPIPREDREGS